MTTQSATNGTATPATLPTRTEKILTGMIGAVAVGVFTLDFMGALTSASEYWGRLSILAPVMGGLAMIAANLAAFTCEAKGRPVFTFRVAGIVASLASLWMNTSGYAFPTLEWGWHGIAPIVWIVFTECVIVYLRWRIRPELERDSAVTAVDLLMWDMATERNGAGRVIDIVTGHAVTTGRVRKIGAKAIRHRALTPGAATETLTAQTAAQGTAHVSAQQSLRSLMAGRPVDVSAQPAAQVDAQGTAQPLKRRERPTLKPAARVDVLSAQPAAQPLSLPLKPVNQPLMSAQSVHVAAQPAAQTPRLPVGFTVERSAAQVAAVSAQGPVAQVGGVDGQSVADDSPSAQDVAQPVSAGRVERSGSMTERLSGCLSAQGLSAQGFIEMSPVERSAWLSAQGLPSSPASTRRFAQVARGMIG